MTDFANSPPSENAGKQTGNFVYKPELIKWRRDTALQMYAQGKTMSAIAELLRVDVGTISRDLSYLREEAREKQSQYIEKELPFRHKMRVANMDKAIAEMWALYENEKEDTKAKKGLLDSITDALIKQAALDGDPLAIERALKTISKIKKQLKEEEDEETTTTTATAEADEAE